MRKKCPVVLQTEIAECGLACICIITNFYCFNINLAELRLKFPLSNKGTTALDIKLFFNDIGFDTNILKINHNHFDIMMTPFIAHFDMNHFVVVSKIARNKNIIEVIDPAYGKARLSKTEFLKRFSGIVIEAKPQILIQKNKNKKTASNFNNIKLLFLKHNKFFILVTFTTIIYQIAALISPLYIQKMIDKTFFKENINLLLLISLLFLSIKMLEVSLGSIKNLMTIFLANLISKDLLGNTVSKLFNLPVDYFLKRNISTTLSKVASIERIRDFISSSLISMLMNILIITSTTLVMIIYQPLLSMICIAINLIFTAIAFYIDHDIKYNSNLCLRKAAEHNSFLIETIKGIQSIRLNNTQLSRSKKWIAKYLNYLNSSYIAKSARNKVQLISNIGQGIEIITIILVGCFLAETEIIRVGTLYAFIFYRNYFTSALYSGVNNFFEYKEISTHIENINEINFIDQISKLNKKRTLSINKIESININSISFRYGVNEKYIIKNISLQIKKGDFILLKGVSGGGKTTFMKLIIGLLAPNKGKILINGIDINKISEESLSSLIGCIMQDDILLAGNILKNITFFEEQPDLEKVKEVCILAGIYSDILKMPMKFHTIINDTNTTLSGGQKQRLMLARALYKDPDILFLDEFGNQIDKLTELKILRNLKDKNKTVFFISHQIEIEHYATQIIDFDILNCL